MLPTSPLPAVVFDLDGLMFNTEDLYQYVGSEILRRRGKRFEADLLNQMMGRPGAVALQMMIDWHGLDASVEELAGGYRLSFAAPKAPTPWSSAPTAGLLPCGHQADCL